LSLIYAWPKPLTLAGAGLCFPGVSQTRVETYAGPAERNPREAPESAWTAAVEQPVRSRYPAGFDVEWLGLGKPAATTAVRLTGLATLAAREVAPDVAAMLGGRRAWLGETLVLADLGDRAPADLAKELTVARAHPPIPVQFTLKEPGYLTLVIEDAKGNRVRNLVSETYCPAGENTLWWDGLDGHRLKNNPRSPTWDPEVDGRLVEPGEYRVRGLVRGGIDLRYEFTVYNPVKPPWRTADRKGQWLSEHVPPSSVLFVPGEKPFMLIGSTFAEGAHGLVWTDLNGTKLAGLSCLGAFTGAAHLAYDAGPKRNPADDAYAVGIGGDTLYLRAIRGQSSQPILRPDYVFPKVEGSDGVVRVDLEAVSNVVALAGLAAYNGTIVVSAPRISGLLVVDAAAGRVAGTIPVEHPRGVAFTAGGALLCVTAKGVVRIPPFTPAALPAAAAAAPLITKKLDDPHGITVDRIGKIYVSDRGKSHQVKVFSPQGKLLRTLGKPGVPAAGPYDELHMNKPAGIAVTDAGEVWVAEEDFRPKRVSVWSPEGKLRFAKYGPGRIPEPGELVGTTRLLGFPVIPGGGSNAGEIWGINTNSGVLYLFTTEGLFVASLFKNGWIAAHQGPRAVRGMLMNECSTEGESFFPTITQTPDGNVYLVAVEHTSSIVRIDGLDSIRRLPPWQIAVSPEQIEACRRFTVEAEAARVAAQGRSSMTVAMPATPPAVDGDLTEWTKADWVTIDAGTCAAAAVADDRLVVAYHTTHADLLKNSGAEPWQGIFKTGGALDVMVGLNRPGNKNPAAVEGDLRLIVALVEGKPRTVLYRPVVPGTPASERVPFSSPSRTIYHDRVTDISAEVTLAIGKSATRPPWASPDAKNVPNGTAIELSVPLKTLGLSPKPGLAIAGDLGILKGDGAHTTFRACWHNQATGLVQDVPGEATLQPMLWGLWRFAQ